MDTVRILIIDAVVNILGILAMGVVIVRAIKNDSKQVVTKLSEEMTLGFDAKEEREVNLNFEKIITMFQKMSDRAKATFLHRLVAVLSPEETITLEGYVSSRKSRADKVRVPRKPR